MPTRVFIPQSSAKGTPLGSRKNSHSSDVPQGQLQSPPQLHSLVSTPRRDDVLPTMGGGAQATKLQQQQQPRSTAHEAPPSTVPTTRKNGQPKWHYKASVGSPSNGHGSNGDAPISAAKQQRAHLVASQQRETLVQAKRSADARYDLELPLAHAPAFTVDPARADAYTLRHDEGYAARHAREQESHKRQSDAMAAEAAVAEAQRTEEQELQKYRVSQKNFQQQLRHTGQTLFNVEPRKEKKLFYWKNHEAPMEEVRPVALSSYSGANRVHQWRDSRKEKARGHIGSSRDQPELWVDSNFDNAFPPPKPYDAAAHLLGKRVDPYQETIISVFAGAETGGVGSRIG